MSRRKYRDRGYRDGGAVPSDPPAEAAQMPRQDMADVPIPDEASLPPPAPAPHEPQVENDPDFAVARVVEATRRAEEFVRQQRAPPPPQSVDEYIDSVPNLSEFKRNLLRKNPHLLAPEAARSITTHWEAAKAAGIPDDSETMATYLLEQVARDTGWHRSHDLPPPQAAPERNLTMQPPTRRGVPMSAPVSRNVPTSDGRRDTGSVTLNAEQRLVARNAWPDPNVPDEVKEREYAKNLVLMRKRQANGEIG